MNNVKEIIIRKNNGEEIILTKDTSMTKIIASIPTSLQIEIYKEQELELRILDAKHQFKNYINDEEEEKSYDLTEDDYINLADLFLESYDCNVAENDIWEYVLDQYLDEYQKA